LAAPYRLFVLDPQHPGTIIANLCWILFNMAILGVATAVAHEQKQRRSSVRIKARIPILAQFSNGHQVASVTRDLSAGGASVVFSEPSILYSRRQTIRLAFPVQTGDDQIPAHFVGVVEGEVPLKFNLHSIAEQEILTRALYSRADSWVHDRAKREEDRPLLSFARVVRLSFTGFRQVLLGMLPRRRRFAAPKTVPTTVLLLLASSPPRSRHPPPQTQHLLPSPSPRPSPRVPS
jgi:cellulose synthase (UDP-forming)